MAHEYFLPPDDDGKNKWNKNLALKLPTYTGKYGISNAERDDVIAGALYNDYWLNVRTEEEKYLRKVIAFKNELRDGVKPGATAALAPVAPVFGAAPAAVEPGIFDRAVSIGNRIKKHKDFVVSDGQDLWLIGTEKAPLDIINAIPDVKIVLIAGRPRHVWKKNGFDALEIWVDRDGTGYKFLVIDTEPDYDDTAALPAAGVSALWKYKYVYRLHDEQVGQWLELSVTVKG